MKLDGGERYRRSGSHQISPVSPFWCILYRKREITRVLIRKSVNKVVIKGKVERENWGEGEWE